MRRILEKTMNELETAREQIVRIDAEMARLFEARMHACEQIADYKKEHGLSIQDPTREAALIARNRAQIQDAEIERAYVRFLQDVIGISCDYQARRLHGRRVTYCGVEGAFAQIAARKMFPEAELTAFSDFKDAYRAVERGEYDCAVLPLENSYAGEVGTVMDLLFSGSLFINQVIDLPIVHNLIAGETATMDSVKTVLSHPQALRQCANYLQRHGYRGEDYSNTALAAKHVREVGDPQLAAIASEETAQLFGLKLLDTGINDSRNNTTRFAAFSRAQNRPNCAGKGSEENFILLFTVQNSAGALAQTLNIIGVHGFNMRSLRSRPQKALPWSYFFYAEMEGDVNSENGRDMLRELSAVCAQLRLVGSYDAAQIG